MMQAIVHVVDGEPMADSREVAAYFGKRHTEVLRAIRDAHCSSNFRQRNFASFKIKDLTGDGTSHVLMTKDGFAFIGFGFTGKKAGSFKEAWIGAFNAMEAELRKQGALPCLVSALAPGLMPMMVGRRQVLVDANDFHIGAGDEAVVCGHEGKVAILRGPLAPNASSPWLGARSVHGHWRKPGKNSMPGTISERHMFTVLGRLVEPDERRRRMIAAA